MRNRSAEEVKQRNSRPRGTGADSTEEQKIQRTVSTEGQG